MLSKKIIWIIVAMLLVLTVSATATNNPRPLIKISYNESVTILNITLRNIDTGNYTGLNLLQKINNMNFTYRPVSNLVEGDHLVEVLASDVWGNTKTTSLTFNVNFTLIVELLEPTYGVSPATVFDIVFETSDDAVCKYDYTFPRAFAAFKDIHVTGSTSHRLNDFNWSNSEYVSYGRTFFVACNTTSGVVFGQNGEYEFILLVDETPPIIEILEAIPARVVEYILIDETPTLTTRLEVETDENTICKYSETTGNYDVMEYKFSGFDDGVYKTSHHLNITFPTEGDYNYKVACENLAGLNSSTTNIAIPVNTSIGVVITSVKPTAEYLSTNEVTLEATTNKLADCNFLNSSDDSIATTTNTKTHTKTLELPDGEHSFTVNCIKVGVTTSRTIAFTIDTSGPMNLVVDDTSIYYGEPEYTKDTDKLRVRFSAEDPESGIAEYKFRLEDSAGVIIKDWGTGAEDTWIEVTNLALTDGTRYMFRVNVTNNAGLSSTALSDGITVEIELIVEPACDDSIRNQGETDIDCGGPCDPCSIGKNCSVGSDCISGYCGTNDTCEQALCSNNRKDVGETDIDCGGICVSENKTCGLGQDCNVGGDCTTGYCSSNNICIKDPDDIDEDGIPNEEDPDRDGDGIPNWEDPDDGGDGLCDTAGSPLNEECTGNDNDDDNDVIPDSEDKDTNNDFDDDGTENDLDGDIDGDNTSNWEDPDDDNDGLCDTYDSPLNDPAVCGGQDDDDDNDGIPDWQEVDNDNDLDNDGTENEWDDDMEGDSILNDQDPDDDNDGLCDEEDSPLNDPAVCTGEDEDDDNDGTDDLEEDNDNDGIPDWWEIEHGLNPLVPDSSEIRTETGLSYYEEYVKELEAQREREGIPSDVLEEEGTSFWTVLILVLAIIAVLGAGGYYGYTAFQKRKEAGLGRMPAVRPVKEAARPRIGAPVKPPIARKEVSEEVKKRIEGRMKERREKRRKLFETFAGKEAKKPEKKGPVKLVLKKAEKKKEKPKEGWVTLEELKKGKEKKKEDVLEKLSGFIKSKDIIEEISKAKAPKKDVFGELEKITKKKGKKKEKVFDELDNLEKDLAKEKKNVGKK